MGLKKIVSEKNINLAIWEIEESLSDLKKTVPSLSIPKYTTKRQKEFIISRILLDHLSIKSDITYNTYGAPRIDKKHISISHSNKLCVVIVSDKKVSVDVEEVTEKPLKLSSKFISSSKYEHLTKDKATLIWCAKEAIYKWHEKGNINFILDINIPNFEITEKGILKAYFKNKTLFLNYQKIDNHYLVYLCT